MPVPHYFPATVIGGFGEQDPRRPEPREAFVAVHRLGPEPSLQPRIRAREVAKEKHLYDVQEPCQDLAADYADQLWAQYEGKLSAAIAALASGTCEPHHWSAILAHIQALTVRHPDFARFAETHLHQGAAPQDPDTIHRDRLRTLDEAKRWMVEARFAVVHRDAGAERLIVNDKGYVNLEEEARPGVRGVFVPLSSDVAVLAVGGTALAGEDYRTGPFAQRTLNRRGVRRVNEAAPLQFQVRCVIGHPEDAEWIKTLGERATRAPRHGPFCSTREHGLFTWAVR